MKNIFSSEHTIERDGQAAQLERIFDRDESVQYNAQDDVAGGELHAHIGGDPEGPEDEDEADYIHDLHVHDIEAQPADASPQPQTEMPKDQSQLLLSPI